MKGRFYFGIALFLSLALNMFFLGGMAQHNGPRGPRHSRPFEHMMENAQQLGEPTRAEVTAIMQSYRPALEAQMKRMRESRADLQKLLQSSDYTRERADAQFEAMQAEMDKMQDIAKEMMLDINEKLTPDQRIAMMPPMRDGKGDDSIKYGDGKVQKPMIIPMSHRAAETR